MFGVFQYVVVISSTKVIQLGKKTHWLDCQSKPLSTVSRIRVKYIQKITNNKNILYRLTLVPSDFWSFIYLFCELDTIPPLKRERKINILAATLLFYFISRPRDNSTPLARIVVDWKHCGRTYLNPLLDSTGGESKSHILKGGCLVGPN